MEGLCTWRIFQVLWRNLRILGWSDLSCWTDAQFSSATQQLGVCLLETALKKACFSLYLLHIPKESTCKLNCSQRNWKSVKSQNVLQCLNQLKYEGAGLGDTERHAKECFQAKCVRSWLRARISHAIAEPKQKEKFSKVYFSYDGKKPQKTKSFFISYFL